ncbi:MAG: methyltransferase domain-containing protein [Ferrovibrio sp.]|uniref:pseudaminic acid biosynthesis-associated methylase n=1 Tax=Ferrovibrio sp. TaxID=1917215 RepID=UPI002621848F|nr:pseudaminic acid biosynthesis-associated methylase [Ferrovibrio sp.]MCW0234921.1 methyltransferase domain-containing protein [Ferrovibrio sp.]
MTTRQIEIWQGEFGASYTERCTFENDDAFNALYVNRYGRKRDDINQDWLGDLPRDIRILEVGTNVGNQLRALQRLGFSNLTGIDIQRYSVDRSKDFYRGLDIIVGSGFDIPFKDGYFDLVFTNNVLIHIAPENIDGLLSEMHRVTRRWIWGFEYYAPEFTEIPYRQHESLLWKADYAKLFTQRFSDVQIVRQELFACLDEPGLQDKCYLCEKQA